ncbi:MAG: retroviral-like aspartic protease family protein [Solirubrobacterales bacterium]|nr:retroviral-like aspartic protease family protein [Solirubrobacterales bacterium]
MRRLIVVCLTTIVGLAAVGEAAGSPRPAHAASVVHIIVVRSRTGGTVVAAKVIIHGRAFPFLVDTGASVTLVNPALARRLHLRRVGKPHKFCGVTGCSSARRVRLSNWSIGGQPLPSILASSSPIAGTGGFGFGLLGSDVLSQFGAVTIDYRDKLLTLG